MKLTEEHFLIADANGIARSTVRTRVHKLKGWTIEEAITKPVNTPEKLFSSEELKILRKNGIPESVAYNRLKYQKGWDRERAISQPLVDRKRKTY